ncbi:LysR family transcriptional regulator [Belnapia moabensis]|uniref:LysR family transcriptional regulator n=1 Tax=Belnapia moabensis TaxID=365533 RepID=UPI0014704E3C|nr:LysR family transcriptional regulator [Belnapia moabensis]
MDKLHAITLFCRAAEARSFAAAANDLNIAPSVLSKAIAALEAELHVTLFNRTTPRLALTEAGTSYYEGCREVLAGLEEAEALVRGNIATARGTLRLGIHPAFRVGLLQHLGRFLTLYPEVTVEAVITNAPVALLNDGLDLVLAVGRLEDSSFVGRRLGWAALITCASPAYLAARGRPEHPQDLAGHRAVIPGRRDEGSILRRWTFERGAEREEVDVPVAFVARDGIGIVDAAIGGAGVVRIFDPAAGPLIGAGALEIVLPDWDSGQMPVHAVLPGQRNVPAKVRAFLGFMEALMACAGDSPGNRAQTSKLP